MSYCANCGLQLSGDSALCPHHLIDTDDWAATNRIMCEFFHRGQEPPRLSERERNRELYEAYTDCM